jgi:hypothetical protein
MVNCHIHSEGNNLWRWYNELEQDSLDLLQAKTKSNFPILPFLFNFLPWTHCSLRLVFLFGVLHIFCVLEGKGRNCDLVTSYLLLGGIIITVQRENKLDPDSELRRPKVLILKLISWTTLIFDFIGFSHCNQRRTHTHTIKTLIVVLGSIQLFAGSLILKVSTIATQRGYVFKGFCIRRDPESCKIHGIFKATHVQLSLSTPRAVLRGVDVSSTTYDVTEPGGANQTCVINRVPWMNGRLISWRCIRGAPPPAPRRTGSL